MRDIKFRGKRLDNGEWVEGDYFRKYIYDRYDNGSLHYLIGWQVTDNDGEKFNDYEDVDPATVGQYTGMKDKNGKKIFEGDIMSLVTEFGDTIIREIRFIDGAFCVIGEQEDDLHGLSWAVEMCDGIVGDNIHDNPDLLK